MAGAIPDNANHECPICHEDYQNPKILPCCHVACKNCIVFWLNSHDGAECPICRFPIQSGPKEPVDELKSSTRLATLVDRLPTDFLKMSLAKGHRILSAPRVCALCSSDGSSVSKSNRSRSGKRRGNSSKATFYYCFHCEVQLCSTCHGHHKKLPVSENHNLRGMETLTPEDLVTHFQSPCVNHKDKMAEVFCRSHQELVCTLCVATSHRTCSEVKAIGHVAMDKRRELKYFLRGLKPREMTMVEKIESEKAALKKQRAEVHQLFDQLVRHLREKQKGLDNTLQMIENEYNTAEKFVRQNAWFLQNTGDQLLTKASDCILLQMDPKVTKDLEAWKEMEADFDALPALRFDDQARRDIKSALAKFGEKSSTSTTTTTTTTTSGYTFKLPLPLTVPGKRDDSGIPRRPPLFTPTPDDPPDSQTIPRRSHLSTTPTPTCRSGSPAPSASDPTSDRRLFVGDKVKLSPSGRSFHKMNRGVGTVVAIPSLIRPDERGQSGKGFVDIHWKDGSASYCCYGHRHLYDLILVRQERRSMSKFDYYH